jgi:PAS domain S-box-containing protein
MTDVQAEAGTTEDRADEFLENLRGALLWEVEAAAVRLSFISKSAAVMLGAPDKRWAADEGLLRKHLHPDDWGRFLETLYQAAAEGGVHTCEHRMLRVDGSMLWVLTTIQRSSRSNGMLLLAGLTVDITPLKQQERSLREAEAQSRLLLESIRDYGVFMLALDGSVATWPSGAQRLAGYQAQEIIGTPLSRLFPAEELARGTPGRLLESAELGQQAEYEGWLVRRGGKPFWASLTLYAVTDERGRLRGFSIVARELTQRRQAEQALREREAHFRLLVESQEHGVFMVSPAGVVESWNRGAQRLTGYRSHEIIGTPMSGLFPVDVRGKGLPERLLTEAARVGGADYEGWLIRKDAESFWGLLSIRAVEDEDGRLRGFSLLTRDVTERRRAEQELRRNEEYFRLLVESVQDHGVFMLSPDGKVTSWNPGAERMKRYKAEEIIGAPFSRFFPPEQVKEGIPQQMIQRAAAEGHSEYEGWLHRKGGVPFWGNVGLSAVLDEEGHLRGLTNVARDLTERMRAERAMSFLADVGRVLAGSLDYRTTLDRVAQLATRELAQVCIVEVVEGTSLQRVAVAQVDEPLSALVEKALRRMPSEAQLSHGVARVVQTGQSELIPEVSNTDKLGVALGLEDPNILRDLQVQSYMCVPLTARGKTFGAMVLVATAHRHYVADDLLLAEELARRAALAIDNARLYEQAQTAIRMREEVLAVVSHDLRNPLSTIRTGAAQLLAEAQGDEQRARTARIAERLGRASERMLHMIRDLLDFSSIEAGKLRIELTEHDSAALVTEVVEMLQPLAAEKGVRLASNVEGPPLTVRCDRERVMQVLSNLIGNSIKFTGEGGSVTVRSRGEGDRVLFSVNDTGPGIAEEDRAHIFDRYWQARSRNRESLGLGLAISKAIIDSHGGRIWVESTVSVGTTFFFTLPAAP